MPLGSTLQDQVIPHPFLVTVLRITTLNRISLETSLSWKESKVKALHWVTGWYYDIKPGSLTPAWQLYQHQSSFWDPVRLSSPLFASLNSPQSYCFHLLTGVHTESSTSKERCCLQVFVQCVPPKSLGKVKRAGSRIRLPGFESWPGHFQAVIPSAAYFLDISFWWVFLSWK